MAGVVIKRKKKKGRGGTTFQDEFYVKAYLLAKSGMSNLAVSKNLGCSITTFHKWLIKHPALQTALTLGRKGNKVNTEKFHEYIYDHLPAHLRSLWDEIQKCEEAPDAQERIECVLEGQGKRARQHLFIYALVARSFNASAAMRACNVSKAQYDRWVEEDPGFAELIDEVHFHKKNFFEGALISLVAAGDSPATLFANKSLNKDRGYHDKVTVEHSGEINHNHTIDIDSLDLSMEIRVAIMEALRKQKEQISAQPKQLSNGNGASSLGNGKILDVIPMPVVS